MSFCIYCFWHSHCIIGKYSTKFFDHVVDSRLWKYKDVLSFGVKAVCVGGRPTVDFAICNASSLSQF